MADSSNDVGKDIERRFIGQLYEALCDGGFVNHKEDITPSLLAAVEESRNIPMFSAKSPYCLDELADIFKCAEAEQTGLEVITERLEKWNIALQETLASRSSTHQYHTLGSEVEDEHIAKIAKEISKWIRRASLLAGDMQVGLESKVVQVYSLLDVGSDDDVVRMVGIHGTGGIGKTTLAHAVFDSIAGSFESVCFLGDVREKAMTHGLVHLQKILLYYLVGENGVKLGNVDEGISMLRHRLCQKKVLLIVDDVDELEQLRALVGDSNWFGSGSRVIITTRDKGLLASHGVETTYEIEKLDDEEALDLLKLNAFVATNVDPSYADILNRIVTFASGLPLALKVIGSNLFGKSKEEWESALDQYLGIPKNEIHHILKITLDGLEEHEKKLFLDIACFFHGYNLKEVETILRAHHGVCPKYGIRALVDKSLVKVDDDDDRVTLHDLIKDMGREIVRQESIEEPGMRSRIWLFEDVKRVLEENKGSSKIETIYLMFPEYGERVKWDGGAFKKMNSLKTLIIYDHKGRFSEGPKHLPNTLRVLQWMRYPSQVLTFDLYPKELARLELPYNCLSSLNLLKMQEKFVNLRVLNFNYSQVIKEIPDVSVIPNLEELSFCGCKNLEEVHKSVGLLDKLRRLDAQFCKKLRSFPAIKLISLEYLNLSYCRSLESFPEILEKMEKLTELRLHKTSITEFPISIWYLTRLQRLDLNLTGIFQVPSIILVSTVLKHLKIHNCQGLLVRKQYEGLKEMSTRVFFHEQHFEFINCNVSDEFLEMAIPWFANVTKLDLSRNSFTILPACIKICFYLRELILNECCNLQEIKGIPPSIEKFSISYCHSLKDLDLSILSASRDEIYFSIELYVIGCINLREIRGLPPNIEVLDATYCTSLTSSCRNMLLDEFSHKEGGDKEIWWSETKNKEIWLSMTGTKIPTPFNHSCWGPSISFWFRNEFPAISLCFISEQTCESFCLKFIVNGHEIGSTNLSWLVKDHILILPLGKKFKYEIDDVYLENKWNHVKLFVDPDELTPPCAKPEGPLQIGLHVLEQSSTMEDVRFTAPLPVVTEPLKETEDSFNEAEQQRASSSSAKIQKTAAKQLELTISSKNHDKDSDVQLVKTTTVPDATSEPSPIKNKGKQVVLETQKSSDTADTQYMAKSVNQPPTFIPENDLSPDFMFSAAASDNDEREVPIAEKQPLADAGAVTDTGVQADLAGLTLSAEHVALLGPFLSRFPLMRLTTPPRHRSMAYDVLGEFLGLITNSSLAEISGPGLERFLGLVLELKAFFLDHVWLDGLVAQVDASSSENSLPHTRELMKASRQRIDAEEQRLTMEITRLTTELTRHNQLLEELGVERASLDEEETQLRSHLEAPLFRL